MHHLPHGSRVQSRLCWVRGGLALWCTPTHRQGDCTVGCVLWQVPRVVGRLSDWARLQQWCNTINPLSWLLCKREGGLSS
jgi:hypothetical protein